MEGERRRAIGDRVEATRPGPPRRSLVPVTAEWRRSLDRIRVTELLASIDLLPGQVIIHCQNMEHLLQQLVQLAKTLDNDKLCSGALNWHGSAAQPAWRRLHS